MKASKKNQNDQYQGAPAITTPGTPITPEQIRQRAHAIYTARGSAEGMALADWLQAEQELKRELNKEKNNNQST